MKIKKIILVTLLAEIISIDLSAQTIAPKAKFFLNLDYSRFLYDAQHCYLEIYYGFHPKHLTYHFSDGQYQSGVKLTTKIKNKETDELVVSRNSLLEISEKDTSGIWYRYPFITQAGYAIPHGNYILEVMASDSLTPSRRDSITLDVPMKTYGPGLAVSDIELCKNIASSTNKNDLFYKNSLQVLPYPSLIFGPFTIPVVFHYVELYNLNPGNTYKVKTDIINSNNVSIHQMTKERQFKNKNSIEVGTTPVTAYPSGKYSFRLTLLDENQNAVVTRDKVFYILNQQMQTVAQESSAPNKEVFTSFSNKELTDEFLYAHYVASDEEIKFFDQLESSDAKREFLYDFWTKVAKGRRDLPPINRMAYLARVDIANEKYGTFSKKGWQTDRGRVLMVYSEPDEVERSPNTPDAKPYEIWRYYRIENGVEFVFVDRRGFGDMELVHSTKRGEFMDENWEQYLR
ncbi:MAG: GWxTD domain-containing protein [bacterium]